MKTQAIGQTATNVFPIGLGAMPLSNVGRPSEQDGCMVIQTALDFGVNFIDTANVYCLNSDDIGHNERLIAKALKQIGPGKEVFVATKGGLTRTKSGDWALAGDPKGLRDACEKGLSNLGSAERNTN